jgi:hypothetical protein
MFKLNDRVKFAGRSQLESHNISTVGVPGIVCSTHSSAPAGWITVWVDWQNSPYADLEDLPMWINTEACYLEYLDDEVKKPARSKAPSKADKPAGNVLKFPS